MQSTTTLTTNREKAERLIALRDQIKQLTAEEKQLKQHFVSIMDHRETNDLLVQSAILISRHDRSRTGYDSKRLDTWFEENGIDSTRFIKTTHYSTITAKAV